MIAPPGPGSGNRGALVALLLVGLAVRLVLTVAWKGSEADVGSWVKIGQMEDVSEAYAVRVPPYLGYTFPPPWHALCRGAVRLAEATGWSPRTLIRWPAVLADLVLALMIAGLARGRPDNGRRAIGWILFSSPLVLVSALHGQFDMLAALPAAWAFLLTAERSGGPRWPAIRAAAWCALALAIAIKKWPLALIPAWAVALERRGSGARSAALIAGSTIVPAVLWTGIESSFEPSALRKVFLYGGVYPWWGPYSGLELVRKVTGSPFIQPVMDLLAAWGSKLFLAAIGVLWWRADRGRDPVDLALLTLALFQVLAVNVAPHYTSWIVPFVAIQWVRGQIAEPMLRALRVALIAQAVFGLAYVVAVDELGGRALQAAHGANCLVTTGCWAWWCLAAKKMWELPPQAAPTSESM